MSNHISTAGAAASPTADLSAVAGPFLAAALYAVLWLTTSPYRDRMLRPGAPARDHSEQTDAAASEPADLEVPA